MLSKERILVVVCLALAWAGSASAISFEQVVDFASSTESASGITYTRVEDTSAFSYSHTIEFDPEALEVQSAFLDVTHKLNRNNDDNEVWLISSTFDQAHFVGVLGRSQTSWVTNVYSIPGDLFGNGDSWTLVLNLTEENVKHDQSNWFWLDQSRLYGEYSPLGGPQSGPAAVDPVAMPEPATMLLLGSGLLALAGGVRRRTRP